MNHTPSDARAQRLAKALRDNLRRRKTGPEPEPASPSDETLPLPPADPAEA